LTTGLAGCAEGDGDGDGGSDGNSSDGDSGGTVTGTPESSAFSDDTITFVMSPSEPQELMQKQYQPVKEYLNEELDPDVELQYAANYTAVTEALGSGQSHIAEMGPFAAALGVRADKLDIVLQRFAYGSWEYTSTVTTRSDSDISDLSDLEDETVALADQLSASGSLFPLYMMKEAGIEIGELPRSDSGAAFNANYAGGHGAAFEAMSAEQAAAAGVGQFITLNDDRELKDGFEYVDTYEGIPRAPIAVTPDLSDEARQQVIDAFTNAPEEMYLGEDGEADTDDDLWFSNVREANADTYQPVVDVATELDIDSDLLDE